MKHVVLAGIILCTCPVSFLQAGSLIPLADNPELDGKLTLTSASIHVEGGTSSDINLPDILEADFGETPFKLNYYFETSDKTNSLPGGWAAGNIGALSAPGSADNAGGVLTLKCPPLSAKPTGPRIADNLFFAGCPWTGNFQWTAHLTKIGSDSQEAYGGVMLRDTLAPGSSMFALVTSALGNGAFGFRTEADKQAQFAQVSIDVPSWLRVTRYGLTTFASVSADGKQWDLVGQNRFRSLDNPLIGLFVENRREKDSGTASFDQLSVMPVPSSAQVLPQGVVLQSGSFLAGAFERLVNDPNTPDPEGTFRSGDKPVSILRSKIAAVLMLPTTRDQILDMSSHVGLLMKNGDIQDGDFDAISGVTVQVNSVLLGITVYNRSEVRGCFLHSVQVQPAPYQFRLRDGSIINASSFTINNSDLVIQEISGIAVNTSMDNVAQFRAGPSLTQPLAELNWKATPPSASKPVPAAAPPANTATPADPAANAGDIQPLVQSWTGPNQEQILATSVGTSIEFPLTGKFRAMGVKVALAPDSPPNSQLTIRVLADGREIGHSPPFKFGDQPRFMELTLQAPKTVTLVADSVFAGTKVLFIDPVAIKDN